MHTHGCCYLLGAGRRGNGVSLGFGWLILHVCNSDVIPLENFPRFFLWLFALSYVPYTSVVLSVYDRICAAALPTVHKNDDRDADTIDEKAPVIVAGGGGGLGRIVCRLLCGLIKRFPIRRARTMSSSRSENVRESINQEFFLGDASVRPDLLGKGRVLKPGTSC